MVCYFIEITERKWKYWGFTKKVKHKGYAINFTLFKFFKPWVFKYEVLQNVENSFYI